MSLEYVSERRHVPTRSRFVWVVVFRLVLVVGTSVLVETAKICQHYFVKTLTFVTGDGQQIVEVKRSGN